MYAKRINICVIAGVLLAILSSSQMLCAQTNSEPKPTQNQQAGQTLILPRITVETGDGSKVSLTLKVGDTAHGKIYSADDFTQTAQEGAKNRVDAEGSFTQTSPDGVKTFIVAGARAKIRQQISEAGREVPFIIEGEFLVDETLKMTTKGEWDGKKEGAVHTILGKLTTWNSATDPYLAMRYTVEQLDARSHNKAALQTRLDLDKDLAAPLFCVVSRLNWLKGIDLLPTVLPHLIALGGQLALLGVGDPALERDLAQIAAAHPGKISCVFRHDELLAHQLQGAADGILIPSRFEPCGLTQLHGLRYGNIPVVARVGGLADTVIDANDAALTDGVATGLQFAPVTVEALEDALSRTVGLFRDKAKWRTLQRRGMTRDVGWPRAASRYASLYGDLLALRRKAKSELWR